MALNVPAQGEIQMLKYSLNFVAAEHPVLRLYSNSRSPLETDGMGSYSDLPNSYGYAGKVCSGGLWTVTSGNPSQAAFAEQTWTFTGSVGPVAGYYVVNSTAAVMLWSEQFTGGPYNIVNSGDQIKLTPTIQFD